MGLCTLQIYPLDIKYSKTNEHPHGSKLATEKRLNPMDKHKQSRHLAAQKSSILKLRQMNIQRLQPKSRNAVLEL